MNFGDSTSPLLDVTEVPVQKSEVEGYTRLIPRSVDEG
jgi:hypothetical protein